MIRYDEFKESICDAIRLGRVKRRITQAQLSDLLSVSQSCVSNWEQGRAMPSIYFMSAMSDIFDIRLDDMVPHVMPEIHDD